MHLVAAAVLMAAGAVLTSAPSQANTPHEGNQRTLGISDEVPDSCPVTKLPEHPFRPPVPYDSDGNSWIGTPKLWIRIPDGGIWRGGSRHYTPEDFRFRQILIWWSEDYDYRTEDPPKLTVSGKRLDLPAPPLESDHPNNSADRMVIEVFFPTLGCWEITGQYKGEQLSYVVWLSKPECSPSDLLALLKPDDPAYADAMELAESLSSHGFIVECVLQSKMIDIFEGQEGAALFRTDHGDFEVLFLPKPETFASVEPVQRLDELGRFVYSLQGDSRLRSPHPLDSAEPMFFGKHANQFFITSQRRLVPMIVKAVS